MKYDIHYYVLNFNLWIEIIVNMMQYMNNMNACVSVNDGAILNCQTAWFTSALLRNQHH